MYISPPSSDLATENSIATNIATLQRVEAALATGSAISTVADNPSVSMQTTLETGSLVNFTEQLANAQWNQGYVCTERGALTTQLGLLKAAEQLAITASNSTLSSANRTTLQTQLDSLLNEFNATANTTFNGISMKAQSVAVYHPGSTAVITQITGGSGDPAGSYSIALTPNGASLAVVLLYHGKAVASTSIRNPYPFAQLEPTYNGGPPTVPIAFFPKGVSVRCI